MAVEVIDSFLSEANDAKDFSEFDKVLQKHSLAWSVQNFFIEPDNDWQKGDPHGGYITKMLLTKKPTVFMKKPYFRDGYVLLFCYRYRAFAGLSISASHYMRSCKPLNQGASS